MSYKAKGLRPWKQSAGSFWNKVQMGAPNECWPWTKSTILDYGRVKFGGKGYYAHRVAAYLSGMVPSMSSPRNRYGTGFVLHRCDNGLCCNPKHLYVGSYKDNNRDCRKRGRFISARGEANGGGGKLTKRQVRRIRERYAEGEVSQSQLAKAYGISQVLVSSIVRRKIWTHI